MAERRYDIDWLRVIVFGLLIFYHIGMFFVPWWWHIKNNETLEWLKWPMLIVNQWRLPILFVISGMGTRFALSRRSGHEYAIERWKRLMLPLIVGIILIVPPQVYIERLLEGAFKGSYFSYFISESYIGIYPTGNITWNHLWFLLYLFIYSILLLPIFTYLRSHPKSKLLNFCKTLLNKRFGIFAFIIPLLIVEGSLAPFFPSMPTLIGDWYALTYYGLLFFYGFLMISIKSEFWNAVNSSKEYAIKIAAISFILQSMIRIASSESTFIFESTIAILKVIYMWSVIIFIFGYASKFLNIKSRYLNYANEAIYPFYIFHQTIIIILGYYTLFTEWSLGIKFGIMTLGTFLGSWLLFELSRRVNFLRPFFGMKGKFNVLE